MGNNSSVNQARLFRPEDFSNDPSAFRVFVKKRNKFIPGWLKINDDEIMFSRGGNNFQYWSLAHLRRYGYTCSGVFFFESGRRCATGEGLHTFQSHQAERIFHMVQSKIKIEEYARGSRAGSVASGRVNSLVPNPSSSSRIHPVQRFSSEGANNEFSSHHNGSLAPPPYNVIQEARRLQQNSSPNCPSVISSISAYARTAPTFNNKDRPRSVVTNLENNVTGAVNLLHQPQPRHPMHNPIQGNASSSTLLQHVLHQQHGYALPHHLNSLAASASGSCLMNQSYHSALDSGSPWASQQQLDGDIVMEHMLGDENRCRTAMRPSEQIRVAVPPPRPPFYGRQPTNARGIGNSEQQQQHSYVNVELSGNHQQQPIGGQQQQNGLNVRELHRTDRSRLEFLSTGPGAFQLSYPSNGQPHTPPLYYPSPGSTFLPTSSSSSMQHSFHQFYSPSLHSPHHHPSNTAYHHNQFQQHQIAPPPLYSHHHPTAMMPKDYFMMSQSMNGALPGTGASSKQMMAGNVTITGVNPSSPSSLLYTSNSMERIMPNAGNGGMPLLNYALIEMADKNGKAPTRNGNNAGGGSNSTLITSSTNTMATNATGSCCN